MKPRCSIADLPLLQALQTCMQLLRDLAIMELAYQRGYSDALDRVWFAAMRSGYGA